VKIWEGGLGAPGWLAGGIIAVAVFARVKHLETLALLDCIAVAVPAGHAIGRWGNWFNQELFGRPTDLPWGLEIDPAHRPAQYLDDPTFHPTFLYESMYLLVLFVILLWVERRFRLRKGQTAALYLALYAFGRFFVENLRIDPAQEIMGLRINAWVSVLVFIGATSWFLWLGRHGKSYERTAAVERSAPTGAGESTVT
jgi:prolipoprotein diacylglyceryl transferase